MSEFEVQFENHGGGICHLKVTRADMTIGQWKKYLGVGTRAPCCMTRFEGMFPRMFASGVFPTDDWPDDSSVVILEFRPMPFIVEPWGEPT